MKDLSERVLVGLGIVVVMSLISASDTRAQQPGSTAFEVDEALAKQGKSTYASKGCQMCHALGRQSAGPDLIGVTERRELAWLANFLKDPPAMLESDPIAMDLLKEYKNTKMPNMRLTDQQVQALIHYLAQETRDRQ